MAEAVWILTTSPAPGLTVPGLEEFQAEHGHIARSYWHRSHQMDMLSEWQFTKLTKSKAGVYQAFQFLGEHYWRDKVTERRELKSIFPCTRRS